MSDSDVYLPSASSTESFDTSYSTSKEEMEVARTIQPPRTEEPRWQYQITLLYSPSDAATQYLLKLTPFSMIK